MLIKNEFEVAEPVEKVWQFFDNIPQVAACLPGAELTEDLGDDKYKGTVAVRMGPVRHEGADYYFCCAGCRQAFEQDPDAYLKKETRC